MTFIQRPNASLSIAIVSWLLSHALNDPYAQYVHWVYVVAILVWAVQELTSGVNVFRRFLGAIVLIILLRDFVLIVH